MPKKGGLTLGEGIKRLRLVAGLTQRALAERVGVDPTYLSHLEKNRREPSIKLLRALGKELSVPPGLLLALALWTEMPEETRGLYEPIIESLLEVTRISQLGLPLSNDSSSLNIAR